MLFPRSTNSVLTGRDCLKSRGPTTSWLALAKWVQDQLDAAGYSSRRSGKYRLDWRPFADPNLFLQSLGLRSTMSLVLGDVAQSGGVWRNDDDCRCLLGSCLRLRFVLVHGLYAPGLNS